MIVETTAGRFRVVSGRHPEPGVLYECECGEWLPISRAMFEGRVSMDHAADGCPMAYHQTHDLSKADVTGLTIGALDAMLRG